MRRGERLFLFSLTVITAAAVVVVVASDEFHSIKGMNKPVLLRALWDSATVARFYSGGSGPLFDEENAEEAVWKPIDYYSGRAIKMDLSRDEVHPWAYNRDAKKSAREVIDSVRSGTYRIASSSGLVKCRGCALQTTHRYKGYPICQSCAHMMEKEPIFFQMVLHQKDDEL